MKKWHRSEASPIASTLYYVQTFAKILLAGVLLWAGYEWNLGTKVLNPFVPTLTGAAKVLSEHPLIDGHNDLLILIRYMYRNRIYDDDFTKPFENGGMIGHFDLPRSDAAQLGGTFWSAFVSVSEKILWNCTESSNFLKSWSVSQAINSSEGDPRSIICSFLTTVSSIESDKKPRYIRRFTVLT